MAIRSPAAAIVSFTVNGTPCSGPSCSPCARAASARAAAASARSPSTWTNALTAPSTASMRRRCASTTSVADTAPSATRAAIRRAGTPVSEPMRRLYPAAQRSYG
jgi:hypothetical protein